jgi:hypothetical protein
MQTQIERQENFLMNRWEKKKKSYTFFCFFVVVVGGWGGRAGACSRSDKTPTASRPKWSKRPWRTCERLMRERKRWQLFLFCFFLIFWRTNRRGSIKSARSHTGECGHTHTHTTHSHHKKKKMRNFYIFSNNGIPIHFSLLLGYFFLFVCFFQMKITLRLRKRERERETIKVSCIYIFVAKYT